MTPKMVERLFVGAALTVAASVLFPIAKTTLPVLAQSGRRGLGELTSRTKTIIQLAKEEMEDMVAEAQFERMKHHLDQEIFNGDGK